MRDPEQPQVIGYDRVAAKRAGLTDQQIDEFLASHPDTASLAGRRPAPTRPSAGTFANESTTTPGTHQADVTGLPNEWPTLAREIARGASLGLSEPIEAGARAALGPRKYADVKDDLANARKQFASDNPGIDAVAQVGGGLLTGALLPKLTVASNLTKLGRAGNAAANGALQGAVTGAVNADGGVNDRLSAGVRDGVIGGGAGALFSAAADMMRSAGQLRKGYGAAKAVAKGATPVPLSEADVAERALQTVHGSGKSVADLRAWDAGADPEDVLAEGIGRAGVRRLGSAHRMGLQPEPVEQTLVERARNEVGRVKNVVRQQIGPAIDDDALKAEKLLEAQRTAGPLYDQALEGRGVTDPRILDLFRRPSAAAAYGRAQRMAADAGEELPSVRQWFERAKPSGDPVPVDATKPATVAVSEDAPPVVKVKPKDRGPFPSDEELAYMTPADLKKGARPSIPVGDLTNAQLAHELHYARHQDNTDAVVSEIRRHPDWPEQDMYRSVGRNEEADGVIIDKMGFNDRSDFHRMNFQAAAAEKRMQGRAPRLQALEAEMQQRTGGAVGDLSPENRGEAWEPAAGSTTPAKAAGDPIRDAASERMMREKGGEVPTMTAKQVQWWKLALDDNITALENKAGGTSTTQYRQLVGLRNEVEGLLHEHTDGYSAAAAAYAKPMQERDAFAAGQRVGRTLEPADVPRLLAGDHPDYTARGVANTLHSDLDRLTDGQLEGRIRDPGPVLTGSEKARARVQVATQNDPERIAAIERAAQGASRRLATKNRVLGGSQTAERLADDGAAMAGLLHGGGVKHRALGFVADKLTDAGRKLTGAQLDAEAKLLLAGGPNQMSRQQALDMLDRMVPYLMRRGQMQSRLSAAAGGAASAFANQP